MNGLAVTVVAAGAMGLFAAWSGADKDARSMIHLAPLSHSATAPDRFLLAGASVGGDCVVGRGEAIGEGQARLELSPACGFAYPDLARAARWADSADGTVTFADGGGVPVLQFAVSDGASYETFRASDPLLRLTALEP